MSYLKFFLLFSIATFHLAVDACTIVAVSGKSTSDGRPLLLKNRDSGTWDIRMKIGRGSKYMYLCQCKVPDGSAYSGYNEVGFSIINSNSRNMPNSDYNWNAYIMQLALESCATVDEFEKLLDSQQKPISVRSNYGVMDAKGNVAIFEANAYNYTRFDAAEAENGYLVRTNFSFSPISSDVDIPSQYSYNRYKIASSYLEKVFRTNGYISKEDLLCLTRDFVNSRGESLFDIAPFDENVYTPINFSDNDYIPRYASTSMMVIQGVLPNESPQMTVAWTAIGSPIATVTVPYLISPQEILPQKSVQGSDGHSWFCQKGWQLKNSCFLNSSSIDLAKLYNQNGTGIMQKIVSIEEEVLRRGNDLLEALRGGASNSEVGAYYAWVDDYVEEQYIKYGLSGTNVNTFVLDNMGEKNNEQKTVYYDIQGRLLGGVRTNAIVKKSGNAIVILK